MHDSHDDKNKTFFIDTKFDVRKQKKLHVKSFENRFNLILTFLFQD